MGGMTQSRGRRWIHEDQLALIEELEARYSDVGIRFDTGFQGWVPVQANGRIGRRYFYFRFRSDHASLTVGYPGHRAMAGRDKRSRLKHRRNLRRGKYESDSFDYYWAQHELRGRKDNALARHPSIALEYASVSSVTGDPYAGSLTPGGSADLFEELLAGLRPVDPRIRTYRTYGNVFQRSSNPPMPAHDVVIVKAARRRR